MLLAGEVSLKVVAAVAAQVQDRDQDHSRRSTGTRNQSVSTQVGGAIEVDDRTRRPSGVWAGEKDHSRGNFLRGPDPAERTLVSYFVPASPVSFWI